MAIFFKKGRFTRDLELVIKSELLEKLSISEKYEFLQFCHYRTFKSKEYIYHQNDPGNSIYIIATGEILLYEEHPSKENSTNQEEQGKNNICLHSPMHFGTIRFHNESNRRLVSAQANTPVSLYVFFSNDLYNIQKRYPNIAIKLLIQLLGKSTYIIQSLYNYHKNNSNLKKDVLSLFLGISG